MLNCYASFDGSGLTIMRLDQIRIGKSSHNGKYYDDFIGASIAESVIFRKIKICFLETAIRLFLQSNQTQPMRVNEPLDFSNEFKLWAVEYMKG